MNIETGIHNQARAERIEPALARRSFRLGRPPQRWFHHMLLVIEGDAQLSGQEPGISGPVLAFFPPSEGETVTLLAGAHGYLIGASPEIFGEAIGDQAESSSLRLFAGEPSTGTMDRTQLAGLVPYFSGLIAEMAREGHASRMVVAALVRLMLVAAWRLSGAPVEAGDAQMGVGALLQRFRQSVELNFRHHRPIHDYARELGISTDRLHAICTRTLSRSPLELVHDRLVQEAKLRLERSARSVWEISDGLGFRDPANFSHFFKRKTGLAPARYRALAHEAPADWEIPLAASYHDWP